jgi:hypothetical protein
VEVGDPIPHRQRTGRPKRPVGGGEGGWIPRPERPAAGEECDDLLFHTERKASAFIQRGRLLLSVAGHRGRSGRGGM